MLLIVYWLLTTLIETHWESPFQKLLLQMKNLMMILKTCGNDSRKNHYGGFVTVRHSGLLRSILIFHSTVSNIYASEMINFDSIQTNLLSPWQRSINLSPKHQLQSSFQDSKKAILQIKVILYIDEEVLLIRPGVSGNAFGLLQFHGQDIPISFSDEL
ncbi:hypothetical protein CEXT_578131 [Caerostris extrusa]|uniref:Uncharacterized protein n=1 Tax=Caerostris extrusa TaxID=172846 RepID=A0AAV4Y916_CAEEX|nr:hypothetical protein CEXT_578131 [Caerostris extrusa]